MKAAAVALAAVALAAACGSSGSKPAGSPTTTAIATAATSLTIEVRPDPAAGPQTATLQCDGGAKGTAFLAAPDAATKACAALANPAAVDYLRNPKPEGQVCTQIFGGPETAHVTGTLNGQSLDVQLARRNGCETAGWDLVRALLQP